MGKPRILIIENSIAVTGALKAIANTALFLQSIFSFYFILPKHSSSSSWLKHLGVGRVLELKMIEVNKRFFSLIFYLPYLLINAFELKRFVRINKINLIHVNDIYNLLPPLANLLGCKIPYVCHIRFMPQRFPKLLFQFWLKTHLHFASKVIVVSETLLKKLPVHEKIVLVYDGFPFDKEQEAETLTESKSDTFIFLYLANMMEGKGQNFALSAFLKVHNKLPDWKLRFVGGDMNTEKNKRYQLKLKREAENYGLQEKIEWIGFTDNVASEYKRATIVLNFSESESFSLTTLEALAYGRPLIVSNCGGPTEIVINGVTGLLVENRNIDSMAESMIRLASSPAQREEMTLRARASIEKFNLVTTSEKLEAIYKSCIGNVV